MPIRYPSGDGQLVVDSVILEFRDRVWVEDITSSCVSVPLPFFLSFEPVSLIVPSA